MCLNLLNHLFELKLLVRIKLRSKFVLSAKENESENSCVIPLKVGLDHFDLEFTQAFLNNPSERAIVWVLVPLLADVTDTVISLEFIRCLNVLC